MVTVACCLWNANKYSQDFSREYNESWVEKLYRGFSRNLTRPFKFVVFSDKPRLLPRGIEQKPLATSVPHYGCLIEPFRLNEPTIICGLDMVVVGNVDHLADYCLSAEKMAMPRDPYRPERSINPVVLVPKGFGHVFKDWRGENDMDWLRRYEWKALDDLWPGEVLSLKFHKIRDTGLGDARIIYMHGRPKPSELTHLDWVKAHWH